MALALSRSAAPEQGVSGVTMAQLVLIHLMVICPAIRLVSMSMKADTKRR
jgi:hypothetical protein